MRYTYRCSLHGEYDVDLPLGTAEPHRLCADSYCSAVGVRVYSAPHIIYGGGGREAFHEATGKERSDRAIKEAKSAGLNPVPVSDADLSQRHYAGHGRVYYDNKHPDVERKEKIRRAAKKALADPRSTW